jgi:ribosomal protein S18 acetylase RimI-like enzyme
MVLWLRGSRTDRRDGHTVVRTPDNPTFWWGNFMLLDAPPVPGSVAGWVRRFRAELPDADHVALGIDGTSGAAGAAEELAAAGLATERSTVLTTEVLRPPARPNRDFGVRALSGDHDWAAALALRAVCDGTGAQEFAARNMAAMRRASERGDGAWFGAFDGARMVAGLGVYTDGSGVARYQSVETDPGYRRRGLAGTLVHVAGRYALDHLGARTLVIVADPEYPAIRLYRAAGFTDAETQVQLSRVPPS